MTELLITFGLTVTLGLALMIIAITGYVLAVADTLADRER